MKTKRGLGGKHSPKVKSKLFALNVAALGLLFASSAGAQEQAGYASNHFNPSERGSRWFVLDTLDIEGNGRLAIGMVNDYSYRSLVLYRGSGTVENSVVRNQYIAHLGASMTVADRVRIGVGVPLQLFADGHAATIGGVLHRPAEDVSVGDVRLSLDARLLGDPRSSAILAVGSEFFLPAGTPSAYTGDGKPRALPRVLFAGEAGMFAYAARVGFQIRERNEAWGEGQIGSGLVFGASGGVLLLDRKMLVGPEVFGSTVTANSRAFDARTTPVEGILGAHYDLGENLRVGAGVGAGFTRGYGAPVFRGLVSFEWVPGDAKPEAPKADATADKDNDGVPDKDDACPFIAGPKSDDMLKNGCPPADADRDGVPDDQDACPLVAGKAPNGCPGDTDGDGINDAEDACPSTPGVRTADPKTNGCAPTDRDGDGVNDAEDACPDQKGMRTTDPKTNGCPDPDRDHDGVPNDVDACPDEPGKADPDPKKNGCPKAFLQGGVIKITDQVKFKTASAEIATGKDSEEVLQAVLSVLKAHPEIAKVRVEGHTDDRGDAKKNKALSLDRAKSVVKWLGAHGIDAKKLEAQGFGQERPIDSNNTDEGRTNNRRVEFHVEDKQGSP